MILNSTENEGSYLPEWFVPTEKDVICGWARQHHRHAGNQRFRRLVEHSAPLYVAARTKLEKTQVIAAVVDRVRKDSPGGGFVKRDFQTGLWFEIGDDKARDKVGHAIRRAIEESRKKPSDSQSKQAKKKKAEMDQQPFSNSGNKLSSSLPLMPHAGMSATAIDQLEQGKLGNSLLTSGLQGLDTSDSLVVPRFLQQPPLRSNLESLQAQSLPPSSVVSAAFNHHVGTTNGDHLRAGLMDSTNTVPPTLTHIGDGSAAPESSTINHGNEASIYSAFDQVNQSTESALTHSVLSNPFMGGCMTGMTNPLSQLDQANPIEDSSFLMQQLCQTAGGTSRLADSLSQLNAIQAGENGLHQFTASGSSDLSFSRNALLQNNSQRLSASSELMHEGLPLEMTLSMAHPSTGARGQSNNLFGRAA